jgi:Leucine-rich repeat (LRR) protein
MINRITLLLLFIGLAFWGCEEEQDTTPPTVTITSPQDGSTVSDLITITCMSSDNEGIEKVELWVNGVSTGVSDDTEPYSFVWNTMTLEDGSFTIIVRSYDLSGNTTDSEPIILTVHNTPTEVTLWGVVYSIENTTELNLSNNELTGSIPPEIGNLTNLITLGLDDNQLTGSIPPEIGNLTNLTGLWLGRNQLTGEIPESICDLNVDWGGIGTFSITINQLCPPYPSCIEGHMGTQDTSGCPSVVCETYYNENVAPILSSNCIGCHSGSSATAGLYLDSYTSVYSAIKSGNVLDRVNRNNGDNGFMPQGGQKLSNATLDILQTFFDMDCNE